MDYTVRDSSVLPSRYSRGEYDRVDNAIRIGIVREERVLPNGETRYIVEVYSGGRQIPVSCVLMQKWGGVHNYEEFRVRPWVSNFPTENLLPQAADQYAKRSGDVVIVSFLDGQGREGVILGGLSHPARIGNEETTNEGVIEYISSFNGLDTEIRTDGSYKVTFNGKALNDAFLDIPPLGQTYPEPIYNPIISGSFFGFDPDGSFIASDGSVQLVKIEKGVVGGNVILKSGGAKIELSGSLPGVGDLNMKANNINIQGDLAASVKTLGLTAEALTVSIKGTQMAIGGPQFELFQGLSDLIDALGTLIVTSPVGTCTPLMAAPTWAGLVVPLQIKIKLLTGSLESASSAEFAGDDSDSSIGDDVGA